MPLLDRNDLPSLLAPPSSFSCFHPVSRFLSLSLSLPISLLLSACLQRHAGSPAWSADRQPLRVCRAAPWGPAPPSPAKAKTQAGRGERGRKTSGRAAGAPGGRPGGGGRRTGRAGADSLGERAPPESSAPAAARACLAALRETNLPSPRGSSGERFPTRAGRARRGQGWGARRLAEGAEGARPPRAPMPAANMLENLQPPALQVPEPQGAPEGSPLWSSSSTPTLRRRRFKMRRMKNVQEQSLEAGLTRDLPGVLAPGKEFLQLPSIEITPSSDEDTPWSNCSTPSASPRRKRFLLRKWLRVRERKECSESRSVAVRTPASVSPLPPMHWTFQNPYLPYSRKVGSNRCPPRMVDHQSCWLGHVLW
ncbi:protein Aster-B isoform X17 [Mustela erminea]|uniref:protein Aster-B isoform X17 n=1 Tax=Mustela erminea TaxID=36723 RepID=UPI0013871B1D|nr:protein Aster-B isoform X17 [Mustela erminea]XP_032213791.1 protein Aster-B isoform X17 [Mustela erminea]